MSEPSGAGSLTTAADAGAADWVVADIAEFNHEVGSIVPGTFPAYARIFHPALRHGKGASEVRWAEIAAANGRVMHPAAEWGSITGSWEYQYRDSQSDVWDDPPDTGSLPSAQAERLAKVLAEYTKTPERCWFGVWEGVGDLAEEWWAAPRFELPARGMLLLTGPIQAASRSLADEPWVSRSAGLWWPDDRAWCVGTDIDLMTTYVGASAECVERLVADPSLEALPVPVDQRVTWDSDTVNPLPPAP
jgi:hypothetical protein